MNRQTSNVFRIKQQALAWLLVAAILGQFAVTSLKGDCSPQPQSLIGWWAAENNAADELNLNPGTASSGTSFGLGMVGSAFRFPATNTAYVQVPSNPSLNLSNAVTIQAWIKHDALGPNVQRYATLSSEKAQIRYDGLVPPYGFHFSIKVGGQFYQLRPGILPTIGSWHHVAGTFDGATEKFYIDGTLVASQAASGKLDPALSTGFVISSGGEPIKGYIDEVALLGRALSPQEVLGIYQAGSAGICKALRIVEHPMTQTVLNGENVLLSVNAVGGQPLRYQWTMNGRNLVGATTPTLSITEADFPAPVNFAAVVSTPAETQTSSNAVISVLNGCSSLSVSSCDPIGNIVVGEIHGRIGNHCIQISTNLVDWLPYCSVSNISGSVAFQVDLGTNSQSFFVRSIYGPCTVTVVPNNSLHGKALCGYDGWFRCPADDTNIWSQWPQNGTNMWIHWSTSWDVITTNSLTFEMWPEMIEYSFSEKYPAPGFTYPNGTQAHLFSSVNHKTIDRHFDWMRDYGIDGVFLERFVIDTKGRPWMTNIIHYARSAANRTGRTFALAYDMAAANPTNVYSLITEDWKWMVDSERITQDPRYLHHNGKPVLLIWGFYTNQMTSLSVANQIIDFFTSNSNYSVTLIGGGDWWWRSNSDAGWSNIFRRFDVICPWNVGNYHYEGTNAYATTSYWQQDIVEANRVGMEYMPVIYPGFGWDNLKHLSPGTSKIPRLGGDFFWKQFYEAKQLGLDTAFVAMFDEVDEGTAIFKVSNNPPTQSYFQTYDGLPSDWYLRLTAEGAKVLRGDRPNSRTIPIAP